LTVWNKALFGSRAADGPRRGRQAFALHVPRRRPAAATSSFTYTQRPPGHDGARLRGQGKEKPRISRGFCVRGRGVSQASATTFTVRRLLAPLVVNSTVPSTSAKSVWSRPRPTPLPGWNF